MFGPVLNRTVKRILGAWISLRLRKKSGFRSTENWNYGKYNINLEIVQKR